MQSAQDMREIEAFVERNQENIVRDIGALVAVNSVEAPAQPGAPFGAGVAEALRKALEMAAGMGLAAHNVDGYFGYADLPGKSEVQLAAITHLDVVPAGNGWTQDPFTLTQREGYLLGRGVADDKGAAVLTMYAAKYFAERGETLPYTLRLMFGTNEETGMAGLRYYQSKYENPAFCFTPDAEFPVCYAEKGNYTGFFRSAPLAGTLREFCGGIAHNVVPDRAAAVVRADKAALRETERVKLEDAGDGCVRITGYGVGGHASTPEGTVNAIALVVDYLLDNHLCSEAENRFLELERTLLSTMDGSSAGIAAQDEIFGGLTCIGGTITLEDGVLCQGIDARYPTTVTGAQLTEKLCAFAGRYGATYQENSNTVPFVTDAELPEVQTLIRTYNEVTGKREKPFAMGGGTYARDFPRAVSFGLEEPGEKKPAWVGSMHGADEGISKELLWKALKIYILGIARLMELEL